MWNKSDLEDKPILATVRIRVLEDGRMEAAIANGYALHIRRFALDEELKLPDEQTLIPMKLFNMIPALKKLHEMVCFTFGEKYIDATVLGRSDGYKQLKIYGKYMDLESITPKEKPESDCNSVRVNFDLFKLFKLSRDHYLDIHMTSDEKPIQIYDMKDELIGIMMPIKVRV